MIQIIVLLLGMDDRVTTIATSVLTVASWNDAKKGTPLCGVQDGFSWQIPGLTRGEPRGNVLVLAGVS